MANERNAMAEMAEFMKKEASPSSEEFKAKAIAKFGIESWKRHEERKHKFLLASRIFAEMAKVEDVKVVYRAKIHKRPYSRQSVEAIVKCREIAEEGEKDGK